MFTFLSTLKEKKCHFCLHWMCLAVQSPLSLKKKKKCYLCMYKSLPLSHPSSPLPSPASICWLFINGGTVTRTSVDTVQPASQISGLGALRCSKLCTYSSDNCGGLRSVGGKVDGPLWQPIRMPERVDKKPVASVISENGLSRQSN